MGAPRDSMALFWPREDRAFKNKVCKKEDQDKAPARGACRAKEARPRQEELAGTTEPKHQDPGKRSSPGRPFQAQGYITIDTPRRYVRPDGARGATSFRARQVPGPGKVKTPARHLPGRVALCACAPAHRTTHRAGGNSKDTWRVAVQPGGHGGTPRW